MARRETGGRRRREGRVETPKEFEHRVIEVSRVSRVVAGGKRMTFRACVAVGDRKGRVSAAVAKSADVSGAINKAVSAAQKRLQSVRIVNGTIAHEVRVKFGAARVLLKPAPPGTGIIAGGPIRVVLDLAGIQNVVAKMLGSQNKINNVRATLLALSRLTDPETVQRTRGVTVTVQPEAAKPEAPKPNV